MGRHCIEHGFSRLSCDNCGEKGKVKIVKHGFDCDIVITCKCEDPFLEMNYTRVQSGAEDVVTCSMGVATAFMVYQNILNGGGLAALNNTSMATGHKALANSTYQRYKKYIEKLTEAKYKECMKEVDEAVFRFYKDKGVTPDSNGILDIEIVYDGTWMKRGHTSPIGMGIVTEAYTGFVLDAQVFSKLCNICSSMASSKKKEEFEQAQKHILSQGDARKIFSKHLEIWMLQMLLRVGGVLWRGNLDINETGSRSLCMRPRSDPPNFGPIERGEKQTNNID